MVCRRTGRSWKSEDESSNNSFQTYHFYFVWGLLLWALAHRFVSQQEGKVVLVFLPAYSPELNPDEQVWDHAHLVQTCG